MEVWVTGLSASGREVLRRAVQQLKEFMGGCVRPDGRPMTFAELEARCVEAGDLLSQRVAERQPDGPAACRPTCGRPGGEMPDEPRGLQTVRGEVCWSERVYDCRHCRRSFFPRSMELGLGVEDTVSPRVMAKMVYAKTAANSFSMASQHPGQSGRPADP
jgi:hypothetical protein